MSTSENRPTKALMVFCEGPHDIAFCKLVFRKLFATTKFEHKFAEFPSPLNSLFKTSLENHLLQDMSLDMAHKFFLPDSVLKLGTTDSDWLILLFNCGGKDKIENPKGFLGNYLELVGDAAVFQGDAEEVITETRYLFLYDVDDNEPAQVVEKFGHDYAVIADQPWIVEDLQWVEGFSNAASSQEKGVYLWSHHNDDNSESVVTLEDIVLPLFHRAQTQLKEYAEAFVNEAFEWKIDHIPTEAKRKKAVITALGQKKKPGGSMNVILEQSGFIKLEHLKQNDHVLAFCNFIHSFMGLGCQGDGASYQVKQSMHFNVPKGDVVTAGDGRTNSEEGR